MPNDTTSKAPQKPLYFKHKTQGITVLSYLVTTGGWAPKAWVNRDGGGEYSGQLVVDDGTHPLSTKDAADAVAKKMAIEWIDAQFPSAAD